MTVTKETIIKRIGEDTGWSRTESKRALHKLLGIMFRTLSNDEDILISGFGKFRVLHKSARLGRNPHTLEEIKLKARKVVSFKASEKLRQKTNQLLDIDDIVDFLKENVHNDLDVDDDDDIFDDDPDFIDNDDDDDDDLDSDKDDDVFA
jgi:integration host factor subunit alpha